MPGVGPITALTFVLTLGDPAQFAYSRDVGPYLGLLSRRRQSGEQDPHLRITKCGDRYLRQLLVQCAHAVIGRFGPHCALRRWALDHAGGSRTPKNAPWWRWRANSPCCCIGCGCVKNSFGHSRPSAKRSCPTVSFILEFLATALTGPTDRLPPAYVVAQIAAPAFPPGTPLAAIQ